MFGYVKPFQPELKLKEYELYKAFYCGLCEAMGKHIGNTNRLTLSYDMVFLAIVLSELCAEEVHIEKKRCIVHPVNCRNRAYTSSTMEYCAKAAAVLTYFKVEDNINDTGKFRYRILLPFAKRFVKKAGLEELHGEVNEHLRKLSEAEKSGFSIDTNADIFGKLLGSVFAYPIDDAKTSFIAYDIGYHCGKWIYIIDACDDFEKDKKDGAYNPLCDFEELPLGILKTAATLELSAMNDAFLRAPVNNRVLHDIITNIITLGMTDTIDTVLKEKE